MAATLPARPVYDPQDVGDLLQQRLENREYIHKAAVDAFNGKQVPYPLGQKSMRLCVVHGIRYHADFCFGPAADLRGSLPLFTRTLNARAIMSNQIPDLDLDHPDDLPYCIWYPDVPSGDTLRDLARRYPFLAYHAARACAVAGYTDVYKEIAQTANLLPEVAIAEQARESGCLDIFNLIMDAPVRYKVFDDYALTVSTSAPKPAFLNADTAVRPYLQETQKFSTPFGLPSDEGTGAELADADELFMYESSRGFIEPTFNITEDMSIDLVGDDGMIETIKKVAPPADEAALKLFCQPLPADLTTCHKDLLILMAAHNGDIDRYHRLRRPRLIDTEIQCIIRGIYHNSLFAQWWKTQPFPEEYERDIRKAISARGVMNNDLSYILSPQGADPRLIWYPSVAHPAAYETLVRVKPSMRHAVARAAIYANYQSLFDKLIQEDGDDGGPAPVVPDYELLNEARRSHNAHYRKTLERIAAERQADMSQRRPDPLVQDLRSAILCFFVRKGDRVPRLRVGTNTEPGDPYTVYNGMECDAAGVEMYLSIPDGWRLPLPEGFDSPLTIEGNTLLEYDYKIWPPVFEETAVSRDG
ncbi:hypothetical protein CH35J_003440 [Colletotrichum higginsianum]|uniref:Uncharacterized protein n=1 Tax=Colletotrichum higginsianum TaxID=80884 RepID=A0A4T0W8U1_9PEZI|nr:hypothetical protein CH35J_003440 [Colletotrichum higginsianum]